MNKTNLTAVTLLAATISSSLSVGAEGQPEAAAEHAFAPIPMTGGIPDGHSVCHLIESFESETAESKKPGRNHCERRV